MYLEPLAGFLTISDHVFITRKKIFLNAILLTINISIIMTLKPYIILSILPGALLWLNNAYLKQVASNFIKIMIMPLLAIFILSGGFFLYRNMGSLMGDYGNIDQAVEKAKIIQQDLLREEQYGGNNYNLGEIDRYSRRDDLYCSASNIYRTLPSPCFLR